MPTKFDAVLSLVGGNLSGRSDGSEINYLDGQTQPTEAEIQAELTRLQAEYDSLAYARSRKQEYDKLNQWEMQFDDNRDGTTTWVDSINEIKERFPK
jgi:hypothetical protein